MRGDIRVSSEVRDEAYRINARFDRDPAVLHNGLIGLRMINEQHFARINQRD